MALLILIQVQESRPLSKAAMVAAVLVFIMGVSLLVYFFRRYKRTERELQDEWDRPEQSLFAPSVPSADRAQWDSQVEAEGAVSSDVTENEELEAESHAVAEPAPIPAAAEPQPPVLAGPLTQQLQSDGMPVTLASAPDTKITQRQTVILSSAKNEAESIASDVASAVISSAPDAEITRVPTEVLSSEKQQESTASDVITESILFDDDIWVGLEMPEQEVPAVTQRLGVEQRPADGWGEPAQASASHDTAGPAKPPPKTELLGAARVDSHSRPEQFEPPGITQIVHREPLEAPPIEPVQRRAQPPITEPAPPEGRTRILASSPTLSEQHADVQAFTDTGASSAEVEAPIVPPAAVSGAATMRVRAGSVLGLPAERSHAPLVLGAPVKPRDEMGIGSLSNYGRDVEGGGGHGGTITLASVILLLGGVIASYLFVPSVHSWVNAMVERARGINPNLPVAMEQPKARVFAARNEANKNIVKARGAVDNISEGILNNLEVEVSLERGDGTSPEPRRVPVKPLQLAPGERGVFEFEYDGNRATGFGGYRIVRLLSGGNEIKFATPGRSG
ncbi:MAG: hypothetical protein WAU45_16065 [Blastocatellia bacterium]